jgi:D-serine deaminase-like pyridoxal phosphate-dependent protein
VLDTAVTPALLLDLDVLERNVARMAARAKGLGVALRPHLKTHKCVEIARLQREAGARGVTVSTFPEARSFARGGFDDILLAVPLDPGKAGEAIEMARAIAAFRAVVDDRGAAEALAAAARAAGLRLHVWLKVDCGYHRAGVDPSKPGSIQLARFLDAAPSLEFDGILSHSGHAYAQETPEGIRRVAEEERAVMAAFAERLRGAGVAVKTVSVGSTPSMTFVESLAGVDEARPGNYVFYDGMQVGLGTCRVEDVAVSVLATVVSHQDGASHFIVDAGALSLSKDGGPAHVAKRLGMGALVREGGRDVEPGLTLDVLSQEHGLVRADSPARLAGRFRVGDRVRVLPNHSCLTVAQFDEYVCVRAGREAGRWAIDRTR